MDIIAKVGGALQQVFGEIATSWQARQVASFSDNASSMRIPY